MNSAIWDSVRIADEPRFPHRTIGRDERRNFVCGAVRGSHCDLQIICRTRTAERRNGMAPAATYRVTALGGTAIAV